MQITAPTIQPRVVARPVPGQLLPIAQMELGRVKDGIVVETKHDIVPLWGRPLFQGTGSLRDAITGAQAALTSYEQHTGGRALVALEQDGNAWTANLVHPDEAVVRAVDFGPHAGGIASVAFTNVQRGLAALITSKGVLATTQGVDAPA